MCVEQHLSYPILEVSMWPDVTSSDSWDVPRWTEWWTCISLCIKLLYLVFLFESWFGLILCARSSARLPLPLSWFPHRWLRLPTQYGPLVFFNRLVLYWMNSTVGFGSLVLRTVWYCTRKFAGYFLIITSGDSLQLVYLKVCLTVLFACLLHESAFEICPVHGSVDRVWLMVHEQLIQKFWIRTAVRWWSNDNCGRFQHNSIFLESDTGHCLCYNL